MFVRLTLVMPSPKGDAPCETSSIRMVGWGCWGIPSLLSLGLLELIGVSPYRGAHLPGHPWGCWWFLRDGLERIRPFPPPALPEPVPAMAAMITCPLIPGVLTAKPSWGHGKTFPALTSRTAGSVQSLWSFTSNAKNWATADSEV